MNGCHKWVLICLLGIAVLALVSPQFNYAVAAVPAWVIALLMVGCCVAPILWSATSTAKNRGGSCCGDTRGRSNEDEADTVPKDPKKPSCH